MSLCPNCGREILWITMEDTGKKLPIDIVPDDQNGTVIITAGTKGKVCTRAELVHYAFCGRRFYKPHFPRQCRSAKPTPPTAPNVVRFPGTAAARAEIKDRRK